MKSVFGQTRLSAKQFQPVYNEKSYLERTRRNHHWFEGPKGQMKLRDMRVGVAGLGGMGSNLAEILVRLGVGHIKIADPDVIEASNLNRQVIANQNTIGMKKADASALELRNISNDFELVVYDDGITQENAEEFVDGLDVVIDEIDVFPFRPHIWLHQAARKRNLPLYSGYIVGLGTHVYKFQGEDYTFEDFMLHNEKEIDQPSVDFIMSRFVTPPPSYLKNERLQDFAETLGRGAVPIFGATTYISQSLVAVRLIADFLGLSAQWGVPNTPVMPKYLRLDPFDMSFKIMDINAQTSSQ
jgi:molybdopterin/thiamine biosynthesis adenylyltransferase